MLVNTTISKNIRVDCQCVALCKTSSVGSNPAEVFQISINKQSGDMQCYCSTTYAAYMNVFPNRYLEVSNISNSIQEDVYVVRNSRVTSLPFQPLLFYPLDDVSRGRTEGVLSNQTLQGIDFKPAPPIFNCSLPTNVMRNFLRMIPTEQPQYEVLHYGSVTFDPTPNITIMLWFKKSRTNLLYGPFLEAVTANHADFAWNWWIFYQFYKVYWAWSESMNNFYTSKTPDINFWTNVAATISGTSIKYYINGSLVLQATQTSPFNFGHSFSFGCRVWPTSPIQSYVFDGCLAHVIFFREVLTVQQIKQYADLVNDPLF